MLRRQARLDARLAPLATRGWGAVAEPLRDLLRLGAYQLLHLDRVPPHAAVDTSVTLAREVAGEKSTGFVNALLRKVVPWRGAPEAHAADGDVAALAEHHSHPRWLVERWMQRFGFAETAALLAWNDRTPPLVAQPARWSADQLMERWTAAGIDVQVAPWGAGLLPDRSRPTDLPGYAEGGFVVQDAAQALVVWYADPPADAEVYDACAAPGGKAIALGRRVRRVIAADRSAARILRLAANVARAGSGREVVVRADAAHPPVAWVDVALLDAPCLGTGSFGRHPDARHRVAASALATLAREQAALLRATATTVRPGGLLVYATCSLEPEENVEQVEQFLADHPAFVREPTDEVSRTLLTRDGDLMLLPQRHGTDGAFAARLRRRD